jgi:hypothetical protein
MQTLQQDLPIFQAPPTPSGSQAKSDDRGKALETLSANENPAFLFLELPDNRWHCPHWGFMLKGRIRVRFTDREEVISAGDFYYLPDEPAIFIEEETQVIEFRPQGNDQITLSIINID